MSPDSKMYGRLTVGGNKTSIGHAPIHILLTRIASELQKIKHRETLIIQIEMSPTRLPDSTTFNREAIIEQELAAQFASHDDDSPFPGVKIGRVLEVMDSEFYTAWEMVCDPNKRMGLTQEIIDSAREGYKSFAPDCFEHFPKWRDS